VVSAVASVEAGQLEVAGRGRPPLGDTGGPTLVSGLSHWRGKKAATARQGWSGDGLQVRKPLTKCPHAAPSQIEEDAPVRLIEGNRAAKNRRWVEISDGFPAHSGQKVTRNRDGLRSRKA
jgi:hypothetical protein